MTRYFIEERIPAGRHGLASVALKIEHPVFDHPFGSKVDLSDCLVVRPKPFRLVIWEPLPTKAPAPPKARPHCCYIQTVVFYCSPYVVRPFKRIYRGAGGILRACSAGFEEWDQVQSRLTFDDVVEFEGDHFECGGGRVVWARRRWWMCHGARRQQVRAAA